MYYYISQVAWDLLYLYCTVKMYFITKLQTGESKNANMIYEINTM